MDPVLGDVNYIFFMPFNNQISTGSIFYKRLSNANGNLEQKDVSYFVDILCHTTKKDNCSRIYFYELRLQ